MKTKREHTPVEAAIIETLGYCCLVSFFSLYRQTSQIALRLGVTSRTIRLYKARFRDGEFECSRLDCCMKPAIKAKRELR